MIARIAAFFFLSFVVVSPAKSAEDECGVIGHTAYEIMGNRQSGMSLDSMLKTLETLPANLQPVIKKIILVAYRQTIYDTSDMKEKAAGDFRDYVQLGCETEKME